MPGSPSKATGLALPDAPGTYALILRNPADQTVDIGRLGRFEIEEGYYIYVGSALGSGGLRARCGRHARVDKSCRWHIDYLRRVCELESIWYVEDPERHEHQWVKALAAMHGATIPIAGFGSSDCRCHSHLLFFAGPPSQAAVRGRLQRTVAGQAGVHVYRL